MDGFVQDWHLMHYGRLALGGIAMAILEATAIVPKGRLGYGDLGIWSDDHISGLARIADLLLSQSVVPAIQLGHAGRRACTQRPWHGHGPIGPEDFGLRSEARWPPVSVSREPAGNAYPAPKALTVSDIEFLIGAWKDAARRCLQAGFQIVEIHAAHGYLLHAFLSPLSNHRTDSFGGDIAGRMQFCLRVAEAVRTVWPSHLPLLFRISTCDGSDAGWSLDDSVLLAKELKARGVDAIDCSSGGIRYSSTLIARNPGFQVPFAAHVKRHAEIPTVAVGLITEPEQANAIIRSEQADLVAIGRELLFNANWPLHAQLELEPEKGFSRWPDQYGWWLNHRKGLDVRPRVASPVVATGPNVDAGEIRFPRATSLPARLPNEHCKVAK